MLRPRLKPDVVVLEVRTIAEALIDKRSLGKLPKSRLLVHMVSDPASASEVTSICRRFYSNLLKS